MVVVVVEVLGMVSAISEWYKIAGLIMQEKTNKKTDNKQTNKQTRKS